MIEGQLEFLAVARHKSFTEAARKLGVSKSYVSKQVRALEERLGLNLLHRTTRSVTLTPIGRDYQERLSSLMAELENLEDEMVSRHAAPRGRIKVSVPSPLGEEVFAPALNTLLEDYPKLELELHVGNRRVDIFEDGFDVVVRQGSLLDSDLVGQRIGHAEYGIFASPSYLANHGRPTQVDELPAHRWLMYSPDGSRAPQNVDLEGPQRALYEAIFRGGNVALFSNSVPVLAAACVRGTGLCMIQCATANDYVVSGRLERLFAQTMVVRMPMWALTQPRRAESRKVQLVIDALKQSQLR